MKKLLWTALLCSAVAHMAAGCIIVDDSDPDPYPQPDPTPDPTPDPDPVPVGPGLLDVTWTLTEGLDEVLIDGCVEGVTAEIVAEDIATAEQYIDLFDCVDGAGQTSDIPAGEYDVWVNVYNGVDVTTSDLIAQSGFEAVTILGDDIVPVDFVFPTGGYFFLSWSITDELGPDALCEDVAADGVSVLSTLVGPDTAIDDLYDCNAYEATTPQMLLGEYVLAVSLLDGEASLNEVTVPQQFTLDYGNHTVDLGDFEFVLTQ